MTLKEYFKANDLNSNSFSKRLNGLVSQKTLWRIANGEGRPSPEIALAIEKATDGKVTRMELLYPEECY